MLIKDAEIELYENAVMDGEQPPPYEDPECDVYLWWPSSATPYLLLSEHLVEDVDDVSLRYRVFISSDGRHHFAASISNAVCS